MIIRNLVHVGLITTLLISSSNGELFTSMADLQRLLQAEKDIPKVINDYIASENERLNDLKKMVEKYRSKNSDVHKNLESVSNPINAFRMIKRLSETWRTLQDKMRSDRTEEFLQNVSYAGRVQFPEEEDLSGAAVGLLRLQDTYRLDTKDLANGVVAKLKTSKELSASDCFEIGRLAYNNEDYYHTLLWMDEAMERSKRESPPTATEAEILEYLAFALYKQDNLLDEGVRKSEFRRNIPPLVNLRPSDNMDTQERNTYEALCRNEVPVSVKETSKLYCYYKRDRPFLRIAPFKVEILRFNPLAVLFKNVVIQNSQTGQLETASYRISKSAWLKGTAHEVVERVNNRLEQMTNLEMETAEELQIANYGIAGHYDAHFDFARKEETKAFSDLGTGNRIATVLFYMTKPEKGGGTVFTEIKTTVMPSKNDALFWYNLMRSGEGDLRTRHAACPVLLGVKWVSNKWIHEAAQEFRRPCGLKPSVYERYVGDLGGPEPRNHPNLSPY
ncbi:Procollagen-proline 4-dioxygenase [Aphelenchoides besseyi]|nr:Procollagen-proline 4-dioxygenase [Aphelenchoides besseyi]